MNNEEASKLLPIVDVEIENQSHIAQIDGENNDSNEPQVDGELEPHFDHQQIHSVPYVGLQFATPNEAYQMYNCYGKYKGFGVRKSTTYKSKKTGAITWLFCQRKGENIYVVI